MLFVVALFLFVLLIIVHEYGHFLVAKRNGVEVEEFGIGFPPKIVGKTMGKGIFRSYYTINLLPLGGFVKLKGENDADKRKGSFGAASLWVKAKIVLAGVTMNFLTAVVLLTVLSWAGMPQVVDNQFAINSDTEIMSQKVLAAEVVENSPAERAGLKNGDHIVSLNGVQLNNDDELSPLTEQNAGQEVEVVFRSGRDTQTSTVRLNETNENGYFGVSPAEVTLERSTWSAPIRGAGLAIQFTLLTLEGLATTIGDLIGGQASEAAEGVAGPVGIFVLLQDGTLIGYQFVLLIIALLSITLAVMNALPIPALDGGRLAVTSLFHLFKKPLTPDVEKAIHGTGMALLLALIVLITIVDVGRFL